MSDIADTKTAEIAATPTSDMKWYRLTRGTFPRHESSEGGALKIYKKGDTILLSDKEAAARGHQIEPVPQGQYEPSVGTSTASSDADFKPGDEVFVGAPEGFTAPASDPSVNAVKSGDLQKVLDGETSGAELKMGAETEERESDDTDTANDWNFLSTQNVPEAVETINSLETVEDVEAARKYEMQNSNRKGVLNAADRKLEQLKSAEEEGG